MNPETNFDRIAGYIANTLTPEQRIAFEEELAINPDLKKKLAIHEMIHGANPTKGEHNVENVDNYVENSKNVDNLCETSPDSGINWWPIALFFGLVILLWFLFR